MKAITAAGCMVMAAAGAAFGATIGVNVSDTYTLYRGSLLVPGMRVHVATFDVSDPLIPDYNQRNCEHVADMFMKEPGSKVKFWCERGRFSAARAPKPKEKKS